MYEYQMVEQLGEEVASGRTVHPALVLQAVLKRFERKLEEQMPQILLLCLEQAGVLVGIVLKAADECDNLVHGLHVTLVGNEFLVNHLVTVHDGKGTQ